MSGGAQDIARELDWTRALREPAVVNTWSLAEWDRTLRLARRLRLLGRLAHVLLAPGSPAGVPPEPARHLQAEAALSAWRLRQLRWVLQRTGDALDGTAYPKVLLKGAAYVGQELTLGHGRVPSDVDILVPQEHLDDARTRLADAGWEEAALDAHDQRYYREWSHELPPMRHPQHGLELDLHHNILPPVARTPVDAAQLLAHLQPSVLPGWQVLQPVDQLLHSAAHLFHDSVFRDRLRDLVDQDALLRHFGAAPGFWDLLPARAQVLGLQQSLALCLHFCRTWLGTPVPPGTARWADAVLGAGRRAWLVPMFSAVLRPTSVDRAPGPPQHWAAQALLMRHHWWRMPIPLLVPHLWHKLRAPGRAQGAGAGAP